MAKKTKTILSFFFTILFLVNLSSQSLIPPEYRFKGEVIKVYESKKEVYQRSEVWNFEIQEFRSGEIISFYDNCNFKTSEVYIHPDIPLLKTEYTSNANGNLKRADVHRNNKKIVSSIQYHENTSGLIDSVTYISTKDNKPYRKIFYEYKKGKLFAFRKEEPGLDTFKVVLKMPEGLVEKEIYYNTSGQITSSKKYKYNEQGDPVLINITDVDDVLINQETNLYQYDKKGNWIKRLNTDIGRDNRVLTERDIIYKDASNQYISKEELLGFWIGWGNNFTLEAKPSLIKIENLKRRYGVAGELSYTPDSGILTIKFNKEFARDQDYYTSYNGKILTIRFHNKSEYFHLRKLDLSIFSTSERAKYIYRSSMEKLKIRPFGDPVYGWLYAKDLGYFRFKKDKKYGLLNPSRNEIVPAIYDNVWVDPAGAIIVQKNNKQGIFTLDYQAIAPVEYTSLDKSKFNRLLAFRENSAKIDWYDGQYHLVKSFKKYRDIKPVDINCFKMRSIDGWGLMDSLGNEIMSPQYDSLQNGTAHLLIAYNGKKYGLVNTSGKQISDFSYDQILMNHGLIKSDGKIISEYHTDRSLINVILYNKFDINDDLKNRKAAAMFTKGNEFGYLDGFGKEIKPMLSPWINNRYLYIEHRKEEGFKFYYPALWFQEGQTFESIHEDFKACLYYKKINYNGDPREWILNNNHLVNLTEETINGIKVYKYVRISKKSDKEIREQFIYFVLNETQFLQFRTYCPKSQYLKVAQKFYDMIYTFELKK